MAAVTVTKGGRRHKMIFAGTEYPRLIANRIAKKKIPSPAMIGVLIFGPKRERSTIRKAKQSTPKITATFFATISFLFCDVIFKGAEN
jgi:hypothetical protein